jgi:hypothetical protein
MDTHIDYLRLASWEFNAYVDMMPFLMESWPKRWERGKWLQYVGWRKEGLFVGRGMQGNKAHTVLNISGNLAQTWYKNFTRLDAWYCTRIDLQRTIKTPLADDEKLAIIRDDCDTPKTTLIESEENDTLYLGSRTSDRFTRLYEKILDETYLRLEFELKGFRSRACWDAIRAGESTDKIFCFYLERSALPERIRFEYGNDGEKATELVMRLQIATDEKKTLSWIISLDNSMALNMASHGIGEQVKLIVRSWAKYADYLDRREKPD